MPAVPDAHSNSAEINSTFRFEPGGFQIGTPQIAVVQTAVAV